jgi:HSP20 family protein
VVGAEQLRKKASQILEVSNMTMVSWNPTLHRARHAQRWHHLLDEMHRTGEKIDECHCHPRVDFFETKDQGVATADLPGVKREDVKVCFHEGMLVIKGEKKNENGDQPYVSERAFGKFCRSFPVPFSIDASKISAKLKDGVLTVTLPKAEEAKPKEIKLTVK